MGYMNVNGIRLHLTDASPAGARRQAAAPPIMLVHGLGGSAQEWEHHVPALVRSRRVLAPSLRGFGHSDRPIGACTIPTYADDLHAVMDALELPQVHLLGFSLGGAVALQAAVDRPERLASLILVNTQPACEVDEWRERLMRLYRVGMGSRRGVARMTRMLARQCFPGPDQQHLYREMIRRHAPNHAPSYLAAIQALAGWSVESRLPDLLMPALVIGGEHDFVTPSRARAMAEALPRGRFEMVRNSRHATPFDQPQYFLQLLDRFLADVDSGAYRDTLLPGTGFAATT